VCVPERLLYHYNIYIQKNMYIYITLYSLFRFMRGLGFRLGIIVYALN
jgi:hypothetical protein